MTLHDIKYRWISDFLSETVLKYTCSSNNVYGYAWEYKKNHSHEIFQIKGDKRVETSSIRTRMQDFFNIESDESLEYITNWIKKEIIKYENLVKNV